MGSAPECSLYFEDRGLEPVHAGIFYMNGRFNLDNLTDLTDVFVNDVTLSKNELMPLSFGDHILIARLRLQFEQRYQLFVNA
ncbi:MAG: FHA domain-containing protein [Phycisphaerae bacterium]|nr:FHA domain-containing protein [Phycisphaerae bacterium]